MLRLEVFEGAQHLCGVGAFLLGHPRIWHHDHLHSRSISCCHPVGGILEHQTVSSSRWHIEPGSGHQEDVRSGLTVRHLLIAGATHLVIKQTE